MDRVVLDTNVVVSALIGRGNPKRILQLIFSGELTVCLSADAYSEYVAVLSRPKFVRYLEFAQSSISALKHLKSLAHFIERPPRVTVCLDPDDDKFVALALATHAAYLITGNKRHFPLGSYKGIRTVSPAEFLEIRG